MTNNDSFSLEDRILCSDDACVGVVGTDGLCGECGLPGGDESTPSSLDAPPLESAEATPNSDEAPPFESPFGDDDERVPCSDGTCVGIQDATGVCGTCGQAGSA